MAAGKVGGIRVRSSLSRRDIVEMARMEVKKATTAGVNKCVRRQRVDDRCRQRLLSGGRRQCRTVSAAASSDQSGMGMGVGVGSAGMKPELKKAIDDFIAQHKIVLFMKVRS